MTLMVSFTGLAALASPGADPTLRVWSYALDPGPADLIPGQRVALALPGDADVRFPGSFPTEPALAGTFVEHDATSSRLYVGRVVSGGSRQVVSFVAPASQDPREVLVVVRASGQSWVVTPYALAGTTAVDNVHVLPAPAAAPGTVFQGRPASDFAGTLPYASEIFGVYQPLAGWIGTHAAARMARLAATGPDPVPYPVPIPQFGTAADAAADTATPAAPTPPQAAAAAGYLSPIGLVNLFREYFYEFDTFLGAPSGHIWISPGGTVEVIESSTRKTTVERTAEQSEDTSRKVEEDLTQQDDLADAVKEDNANDTKLGISASAGGSVGVYHGEASTTFNSDTTVKRSAEDTHKHTRTQSSKATSEIHRNFKTTFRTVTESTDTTSRRYVVQNTTDRLVNYELRRKMRKVGVQVQHLGTRLSWQLFIDDPGRDLGLGELVHVAQAPDLSGLKKPEPPPALEQKVTTFVGNYPLRKYPPTTVDPQPNETFLYRDPNSDEITNTGNDVHVYATSVHTASPPAPGYELDKVVVASATSGGGGNLPFVAAPIHVDDPAGAQFTVTANFFNSGDGHNLQITFTLTWKPPAIDPAQAAYQQDLRDYEAQVAELQREAYANTVRDRLALVSKMKPRASEDLRSEERQTVYGQLIQQLEIFPDSHVGSELIRQIFDVDEMLYFTAPDYWRPRTAVVHPSPGTVGRYPVDLGPTAPVDPSETVVTWYTKNDLDNAIDPELVATPEARINYLITEDTQPAPRGSSLGWLVQMDGDERRNEFLNAAWAKAVLPVRPGHEVQALTWLAQAAVEGETGLDQPYVPQPGDPAEFTGKTIRQVLDLLAAKLQTANTDIGTTLATEQVFESGFDPLDGGFRQPLPYQLFDQWLEVLPTDQVVAVEVEYDPRTGQLK